MNERVCSGIVCDCTGAERSANHLMVIMASECWSCVVLLVVDVCGSDFVTNAGMTSHSEWYLLSSVSHPL